MVEMLKASALFGAVVGGMLALFGCGLFVVVYIAALAWRLGAGA